MKLATREEIELLLPDERTVSGAIEMLQAIECPGADKDWLEYGVKEGLYETTLINFRGEPAYLVFWSKSSQGYFHCNGAISVCQRERFHVLVEGCQALAEENNCRGMSFDTRRVSLIHKAALYGFEIAGVVVSKKLEAKCI